MAGSDGMLFGAFRGDGANAYESLLAVCAACGNEVIAGIKCFLLSTL